MNAAARDHPVPVFQIREHLSLLFLPSLVREKQKEVKYRKDGNERQQTEQRGPARIRLQENRCQLQFLPLAPS
jgi:hypothetical protein